MRNEEMRVDDACLELLDAALDGEDDHRIDLILKLALMEPDAARRAGAELMRETGRVPPVAGW